EIQLNLAISRSRRTFLHRQRQPLGEFLRGRLAADLLRIRCDVRTSALILSTRCGGTWLGRGSAEAPRISGPHERKTAGCRRRSPTGRSQAWGRKPKSNVSEGGCRAVGSTGEQG